jgi:hypothetical protein
MLQAGVRKFLKALYLRRRREAAEVVISFMRFSQRVSKAALGFKKLMASVQTLKVFRSPCRAIIHAISSRRRYWWYYIRNF